MNVLPDAETIHKDKDAMFSNLISSFTLGALVQFSKKVPRDKTRKLIALFE